MVQKILVVLLIVLLLLTTALLVACETAGTPQPTTTPKLVTAEPVTQPPIPTPLEGYPTLTDYP